MSPCLHRKNIFVPLWLLLNTVRLVQLVEHQIVVLGVVGSSPTSHPKDKDLPAGRSFCMEREPVPVVRGPVMPPSKTIKDARSATSKYGLQRERPRPPVRRGRMAPSAPPAADFSPPRGRKAPSAPPATEFLPPFLWQNRNRLTVPSGALCFAPRFYILAEKDCKGFSTANLVAESGLNTPTDTAAIVRQFVHLPLILLLVRADAGQDYDLIHATR